MQKTVMIMTMTVVVMILLLKAMIKTYNDDI